MSLNKLTEEEHTELWCNYCGKIVKNRKEVNNHIFEACKTISSECISKDEVKNYNGNIVVEKEENREIMREKNKNKTKNMIIGRPYYESEKSQNKNNEPKLNVDEQQEDTIH